MSWYGYDRLQSFTREDIERRLFEMLNRKDAQGKPDVATVEDLRLIANTLVDAMIQLDSWIAKNMGGK